MSEKNQLAVLPPAALERNVAPATWNAMKEIYDGASDEKVALVIDYCTARKLDPLKKPVHIVSVWSQKRGAMVETIWPSIAEARITAMRTGLFAGQEETKFGPNVKCDLGTLKNFEYPEWAQVTMYRLVNKERCAFPGPRVYWIETYSQKKREDATPNAMWAKRSWGQIEKCAEAAALRRAFPEELGGQSSAEEMDGKTVDDNLLNVTGTGSPPPEGGTESNKRPVVPRKNKGAAALAAASTTPPTELRVEHAEPPVEKKAGATEDPPPPTPDETAAASTASPSEPEGEKPEWPKVVRAKVTDCKEVKVTGNPKCSSAIVAVLGGGNITLKGVETDIATIGRVIFDPELKELVPFAKVSDEFIEFTIVEEKSASNPEKMNRIIKKAQVADVAM